MILKGKSVVAYLQSPRERFWGVLRDVDPSGVVVEGIEVDMFDTWVHSVAREGSGAPPATVAFFPISRIDRILLDRSSKSVPSLADRFHEITGRTLVMHLGGGRPLRSVPFPKPPAGRR